MTEPMALPSVTFNVNDRGGDYLAKLQALAAAIDSAITAYNASVTAGSEAAQTLAQVQLLQQNTNQSAESFLQQLSQASEQLLQSARDIRDQTQAISASGLPATDGQTAKVLTVIDNGLAWHSVEQGLPASAEQLNKVLTVTENGLAWQQLNRLLVITQNSNAQADFRHLFMAFADLQLTALPDGASIKVKVDHDVDLKVGTCALLAPVGETIKTIDGEFDRLEIKSTGVEFTLDRVNGGWRV